jgi:DNA-binding NtrC family response regulator
MALPSARRVLIVDDERDIRTTLNAVFGSAGYECRMAADGREAARLFEADRSPLTITDQVLLAAERALERRQLLIERREHQALLEYRVAEATRDLATALGELQQTYQATLEALGSALATREVGPSYTRAA